MNDNSFIYRIKHNKKRIAILTVLIGITLVSLLLIINLFSNGDANPTTPVDDGESNLTLPFQFEDPIKVNERIPTFSLESPPSEIFSNDGIVALAKLFGFTGEANLSKFENGYTYEEGINRLSVDKVQGSIRFSTNLRRLPDMEENTTLPEALEKAQDFLRKIQFNTPLNVWNMDDIAIFEIFDQGIQPANITSERAFYSIPLAYKLFDAPIHVEQEMYIYVGVDGSILGVSAWFPRINYADRVEIPIISYLDATERARKGQYSYINFTVNDEITSFTRSSFGYYVSRKDLHSNKSEVLLLQPVYIFENDEQTLYVNAT